MRLSDLKEPLRRLYQTGVLPLSRAFATAAFLTRQAVD